MDIEAPAVPSDLLVAATRVRAAVASLALPLDATGAVEARVDAAAVVQQLDDHVLPRLANLDAPALVVVGGSTGSGKSLLVNSLVGTDVSRSGVLRPTTRSPALIHHPEDASWFASTTILPGLARTTGVETMSEDVHRELRLVASAAVPEGIALLDAPDIDSVDAANRELATQLLAAADVWVFVTTAARYADAVPWDFLHQARDRGTPLVLVLNRVPDGAMAAVEADLRRLTVENRLVDITLVGITEQTLDGTRLPAASVAVLHQWLADLGRDHEARADLVRRSLAGSLRELLTRGDTIADAADQQSTTVSALRSIAERCYAGAQDDVRAAVNHGEVLRGEVLSRWEDFVGTGELMRQLRTGLGRIRDRVADAITGRPKAAKELTVAVEGVVEGLVRNHADAAAAATMAQWRAHPATAVLLDGLGGPLGTGGLGGLDAGLGRSSAELGPRTAQMVREWQHGLLELIRSQGVKRRSAARFLSFGVNGVSMVLMVLVFSHTGGLTGGEVAIAGGTSAVGHALLEALLGDENLRRLAMQARTDLDRRIGELYDAEQARFDQVIDRLGVRSDGGAPLRAAVSATRKALG